MPELTITQNMLDVVLEQPRKFGAREVKKINLVVGEMTGVVEECVKFYFNFLGKGTIAEIALLTFTKVPTRARCRSCSKHFEVDELAWFCPHCGDHNLKITSSKELFFRDSRG